jgi:mannose-6-phosphate isomerase-like protein (cupin superfamily)
VETRVGWVNENPITQERGTVLIDPGTSDGMFAGLLELGPQARVVGEHFHPGIHERFRVLTGTLAMKLDGVQSTVAAGEMVDIPAGAVHDWWNAGGAPASVLVWVDPGQRFLDLISTLFGLARTGRTNANGMPDPLQLAVIATEFRETVVFTRPPQIVQRTVLRALAAVGRARGRKAIYPELQQPVEVVVPEPELIELAERHRPGPHTATAPRTAPGRA